MPRRSREPAFRRARRRRILKERKEGKGHPPHGNARQPDTETRRESNRWKWPFPECSGRSRTWGRSGRARQDRTVTSGRDGADAGVRVCCRPEWLTGWDSGSGEPPSRLESPPSPTVAPPKTRLESRRAGSRGHIGRTGRRGAHGQPTVAARHEGDVRSRWLALEGSQDPAAPSTHTRPESDRNFRQLRPTSKPTHARPSPSVRPPTLPSRGQGLPSLDGT